MPRRNTAVKTEILSPGVVDLHFHGAFGVDLMRAESTELDDLARRLWAAGVGAFCPTTLSAPRQELRAAVGRLGRWIEKTRGRKTPRAAIPIGIHLEGPFISPQSCGAHPPRAIRRLNFRELDDLWEESRGTLKILTVAAERLKPQELARLARWARARGILLSLGHSRATAEQASEAFRHGFRGVTHAWNACGFHHRDPGLLGAALGNSTTYIELILDQVHVAPEIVRWTLALHRKGRVCFVSDATPAAGSARGRWSTFGPLRVRVRDGASRTANGALAGGGILLSEMLVRWAQTQARATGRPLASVLREALPHATTDPLGAMGWPNARNAGRAPALGKVRWAVLSDRKVQVIPIDSPKSSS